MKLERLIQEAQRDPNGFLAGQLRRDIESGKMDLVAEQEGVDLTRFGRNPEPKKKAEIVLEEEPVSTASKVKEVARKIIPNLDFKTGMAKSALDTVSGAAQLVEKGIRKIAGKEGPGAIQRTRESELGESLTTGQNVGEKIGKFTGDVAQFAAPGAAISKATKGAGFLGRVLPQAGSSATVASLQEGEIGGGTAIAGLSEVIIPGLGGVLVKAGQRLFKGIAASTAGVSAPKISTLVENSSLAKKLRQEIEVLGDDVVKKIRSQQILDARSQIRKESSKAYGEALEKLLDEPINPDVVAKNGLKAMDDNGVRVLDDRIDFKRAEFKDSGIQEQALDIIEEFNAIDELNGKSLRNLMKSIEKSKFKTTGSDPDRIAYNIFAQDLSDSIRNSVAESTSLLDDANKAYRADRNLLDASDVLFGKTKFNGKKDLLKVSKKLENILNQKGITEDVLDEFLVRADIDPAKFKTEDALLEVLGKEIPSNSFGLNLHELARTASTVVLSPETITSVSTMTGVAEDVLKPVLNNIDPVPRAMFIKLLIDSTEG